MNIRYLKTPHNYFEGPTKLFLYLAVSS